MAIRIDAASDLIRRNANAPTNTSFTYMADFWIVSDVGAPAIQPLISSSITAYTESYGLYFEGGAGDGIMKLSYTDAGAATEVNFASRPAINTPFCVFLRCSGTAAGQYTAGWRYPGGPWVTVSGTLPAAVSQTTRIEWGALASTYYTNCMFQNLKLWDRPLLDAELIAESDSAEVVNKRSLNLYVRCEHMNDTIDRGFYARNLERSGSQTTGYFNYPRSSRARRPAVAEAPAAGTTFQILAGRKFSLAGMAGLAGD